MFSISNKTKLNFNDVKNKIANEMLLMDYLPTRCCEILKPGI